MTRTDVEVIRKLLRYTTEAVEDARAFVKEAAQSVAKTSALIEAEAARKAQPVKH